MNTTVKTCFKCNVEKPVTDFYVHPQMGDGRLNKCKECTKRDVAENYRKNAEYYKEYERKRNVLPHRVSARREYESTEAGREAMRRSRERYLERYPDKRAAHILTGNAIRNGRLLRQPCEVCGETESVQAHHDDYSKPLDVRWLCFKHHMEHHGKEVRTHAYST
jgi:hypothetical protein